MKISALVCAVLAGSLGFSSIASAQDWRGRHDGGDRRVEQRRDDRVGPRQQQPRHVQQPRYVQQQPRYVQQQPRYTYNAPTYRSQSPHWQRGGYLPHEYRGARYHVADWRGHGLYAPPAGYQWTQVGSDFLLVALATGLIANLLIQ